MTDAPRLSRRDYLRATAVVAATGAIASGTGSVERSQPPRKTETDRSGAYEVTMEPAGTVSFDAVPERWVTYSPGYADMGVALGVGSGLAAVGDLEEYHTWYYEALPEVGFDERPDEFAARPPIDPARFADLDADVHLMDPNWLVQTEPFELDATAVERIGDEVAPFVGNTIFRRNFDWHSYRYYTLYEAFEKVARVFRREDRYEAFATFHDEWLADLQAALPPAEERPDALLVAADADAPEEFVPLRIADRGTGTKQWRDLGVGDALADLSDDELPTTERDTVGYETIARIDPDVLLVRGHEDKTAEAFAETVLAHMRDHAAAGDIRAVEQGRVFRGGPRYQGPISNLFTTERAARAIYPDVVGGQPLFDRERVADIVAGRDDGEAEPVSLQNTGRRDEA